MSFPVGASPASCHTAQEFGCDDRRTRAPGVGANALERDRPGTRERDEAWEHGANRMDARAAVAAEARWDEHEAHPTAGGACVEPAEERMPAEPSWPDRCRATCRTRPVRRMQSHMQNAASPADATSRRSRGAVCQVAVRPGRGAASPASRRDQGGRWWTGGRPIPRTSLGGLIWWGGDGARGQTIIQKAARQLAGTGLERMERHERGASDDENDATIEGTETRSDSGPSRRDAGRWSRTCPGRVHGMHQARHPACGPAVWIECYCQSGPGPGAAAWSR